jgi:hypothetical protein
MDAKAGREDEEEERRMESKGKVGETRDKDEGERLESWHNDNAARADTDAPLVTQNDNSACDASQPVSRIHRLLVQRVRSTSFSSSPCSLNLMIVARHTGGRPGGMYPQAPALGVPLRRRCGCILQRFPHL